MNLEKLYTKKLQEVKMLYNFTEENIRELDNFIREYIIEIKKIYPSYTILEIIWYVRNNYYKDCNLDVEDLKRKIKFVYS